MIILLSLITLSRTENAPIFPHISQSMNQFFSSRKSGMTFRSLLFIDLTHRTRDMYMNHRLSFTHLSIALHHLKDA